MHRSWSVLKSVLFKKYHLLLSSSLGTQANKIFESLNEWGLEKKVFSITLDNAKNNNSILRILNGKLQTISGSDRGLFCDGKMLCSYSESHSKK